MQSTRVPEESPHRWRAITEIESITFHSRRHELFIGIGISEERLVTSSQVSLPALSVLDRG